MKRFAFAAALVLTCGDVQSAPDPFAQTRLEWNKPLKPFHVIGNIYYVGAAGVSAFLITTPQCHIVTDGALPESAPLIEANIKAQGFKLSDVKNLLNSHAHFDHSGSLARLKQVSGARLVASTADKPILKSGHISFGPAANADSIPVKVDQVVADGGTVSLGGVTLTANVTSGHTPGCTTWTMAANDNGKKYDVVFFCGMRMNPGEPLMNNPDYPEMAADFAYSFAKLKLLPVDIYLASHGYWFDFAEKIKRLGQQPEINPFIDPEGYRKIVEKFEGAYLEALQAERGIVAP